jgi:hypothetical protein
MYNITYRFVTFHCLRISKDVIKLITNATNLNINFKPEYILFWISQKRLDNYFSHTDDSNPNDLQLSRTVFNPSDIMI